MHSSSEMLKGDEDRWRYQFIISFCGRLTYIETLWNLWTEAWIDLVPHMSICFASVRWLKNRIWTPLSRWLDYFCCIELDINNPYEILFNCYKGPFAVMTNTIILIAKHYIYVRHCLKEKLIFASLVQAISQCKFLEQCIAKRNKKCDKFEKKWQMYDKV